ncbi:MAG: type IV pilus secretin PilQ [bacterium]|nr:type IV pilus secretin PilQ [bacterium]
MSLGIALLAVTPKMMAASTADAAISVITAISTEASADTESVIVQATGQLQYTAFKLREPLRLVVDVSRASLGDVTQPIPTSGEIVERIEPIVFADEDIVRLMFYLRRGVSHHIESQGQQLRITLQGAVESPPAGLQQAAAIIKRAETVVEDVSFVSFADRSVLAMQIAGTAPQVRVRQRQEPLRLIVDIKDASLSSEWAKAALFFDPSGIVKDLRAKQVEVGSGSNVRVEIYLRSLVPFEVQQDEHLVQLVLTKPAMTADAPVADASGSSYRRVQRETSILLPLVAQVMPVGKTSVAVPLSGNKLSQPGATRSSANALTDTMTAEQTKKYTGEKISLDFQNADINDILRLIAEVSGLNVIAGGDVQGTVTTRMVDVPWDQALDVILKINGLAQEREGNIIRVAPLKRFIAERQERMEAQQTESQSVPTVTRVVPVNYADAAKLKTNLERLLSDRGSIFIDERTNTLIITDTQENLDSTVKLLETLDRQTPQVMIEARIVETSRNFLRDLGVQLGFTYTDVTDRKFPNRVGVTGSASDGNFLVDLPAAVAAGSGGAVTFALAGASSLLNIRLSALEASGQAKIISSPKIATLDNTEAHIQSGRRIPFATVSAEGTQTEFVDASVSLRVTPHITPDGFISMKIVAENNEADFGNTSGGVPTIVTREATTEMLVKDGDTVVIGGLYKRTISESSDGVPGLRDVPILGWLFNKKRREDTNEELLIFITPRIIRQPKKSTKTAVSY